uniref:Uncharacterized protein n=1 Tax=Timema shepardi TaxID=629360 RepID=A0A7R9B7Q5_TIMSH|nr:unnamed protein product [Timema shepardi]
MNLKRGARTRWAKSIHYQKKARVNSPFPSKNQQHSNYGAQQRSLGARRGVFNKFVSPVASSTEDIDSESDFVPESDSGITSDDSNPDLTTSWRVFSKTEVLTSKL